MHSARPQVRFPCPLAFRPDIQNHVSWENLSTGQGPWKVLQPYNQFFELAKTNRSQPRLKVALVSSLLAVLAPTELRWVPGSREWLPESIDCLYGSTCWSASVLILSMPLWGGGTISKNGRVNERATLGAARLKV